jgi:serine/threonine protein kinase
MADARAASVCPAIILIQPPSFSQVGEKIAGGSFGNVWEATVMTSGLEGVVKVPYPDPDLDGEEACRKFSPPTKSIRESFAREIELLGSIDHPNVVTMLGATEDMACIVLELGKTDLYNLVKRLKLRTPIATFRDWSRQILDAVAFLHENSVLHRVQPSALNPRVALGIGLA